MIMRRVDVEVHNHGSILLVKPVTEAAEDWIHSNVPEYTEWSGSMVVEQRYIRPLMEGMEQDGLSVRLYSV